MLQQWTVTINIWYSDQDIIYIWYISCLQFELCCIIIMLDIMKIIPILDLSNTCIDIIFNLETYRINEVRECTQIFSITDSSSIIVRRDYTQLTAMRKRLSLYWDLFPIQVSFIIMMSRLRDITSFSPPQLSSCFDRLWPDSPFLCFETWFVIFSCFSWWTGTMKIRFVLLFFSITLS